MATYYPLFLDQGSTFAVEMFITANDGNPFILTGCTIYAQIREYPEAETAKATFSGIIVDENAGHIMLSLTDEQTALLTSHRYVYDVVIENILGQRYRVIEGIIDISLGVTRAI